MDKFDPPDAYILKAISERTDELKVPLTALYLRFVTEDLGNDLSTNTLDRVPGVTKFMHELATSEGLPTDVIDSAGAFSNQPTMESRNALIQAINLYLEPFDEEDTLGKTYLRLLYPDRASNHEFE